MTIDNNQLFNEIQVAERLRISPATLRSWRARGIGPVYVKLGPGKKSPVRYRSLDLARYVENARGV